MPGSIAAALAAAQQGVQIVRVHDVAATRQALDVWRAAVTGRQALR
jgi:dihydropteroate synthase